MQSPCLHWASTLDSSIYSKRVGYQAVKIMATSAMQLKMQSWEERANQVPKPCQLHSSLTVTTLPMALRLSAEKSVWLKLKVCHYLGLHYGHFWIAGTLFPAFLNFLKPWQLKPCTTKAAVSVKVLGIPGSYSHICGRMVLQFFNSVITLGIHQFD